MSNTTTFLVGSAAFLPSLLLVSNSLVAAIFAVAWLTFVYNMPKIFPSTKKFWRTWHRVNLRVQNELLTK